MDAQTAAGLLLMVIALVVALFSQRRAIRRDAAAIEHALAEIAELSARRLEREQLVREREAAEAVERVLAKRAALGAMPAGLPDWITASARAEDGLPASIQRSRDRGARIAEVGAERSSGVAVAELLDDMSFMDLNDLVKAIEEKFGVSAAAVAGQAGDQDGVGAGIPAEHKTEFNVVLTSAGANKVSVIKAVRELTGLGLKEAKDLVDGTPRNVVEAVAKTDAEAAVKKLVEAGATVKLK